MAISPFKIIISVVLFLRIILFALPSFEIDMNLWIAWTERIISVGPFNFYSQNFFSDYFPGYLYILWVLGIIHGLFIPFSSLNEFSFEILLKSTTLVFDIGTAFYIFKIIQKHQKNLAHLGFILYLANPTIIFNSSVWGQIDGIFTFFLILSAYYLTERKNVLKSNIFFSFAIIIKPQSLALLPIMLKENFTNKIDLRVIKKLLFIPALLIILSLPFFISDPLFGLLNLGLKASDVYPYNSLFAFNFWSLFGFWENDSKTWSSLTYQVLGFILYGGFMLLILLPMFLKKIKNNFYLSAALSFLVFYLFLTRMHERYIFPYFAFILIAALLKKSKKLFVIYVISSFIHLVNLWYVYYYYNFVFKGMGGDNFFYNIIGEHYKVLSISLLLIFTYLLTIYLLPAFKPKIRII